MKNIYFDMDGTIADLYAYPNWLEHLQNEQSDFERLAPMVDMVVLNVLMAELKKTDKAVFSIATWLPMNASEDFEETCADDKIEWVFAHFGTELYKNMHCMKYGTPKHTCVGRKLTKNDVLVDDNMEVLTEWIQAGGTGVVAHELLNYLYELL